MSATLSPLAIWNRLAAHAARAVNSVSAQIRVAVANLWRDHYNPLRGLTMRRAVQLLEDETRGAFADLQWTYRAIEGQDATLGALVERRTGAIQQLDWDIKVRDDTPPEKKEVAELQRRALKAAYERLTNLEDAIENLALASFRGFAHLEKIEEGGAVVRLDLVDQWYWVREGLNGEWRLNKSAAPGTTKGETVDLERFVIREVARPINRVALVCFVRKGLSQKDWDAYVEEFGLPAVFVILPSDVPTDKLDEYAEMADKITGNARGTLPGGSNVKTVSAPRNSEPFEKHIRHQDEQLVLRGTGGLLTMLTASGSGTLAGSAHQEAFDILARAEARKISAILREQFDQDVLYRTTPDEPAWAYFELAANEENDPSVIVKDTVALEGAGFQVDAAWVSEKSGYPVTRAPKDPPSGQTGLAGALRGPAAAPEDAGRPDGAGRDIPPSESTIGANLENRESGTSGAPRDWLDEAAEAAFLAALEGGGGDPLEAALLAASRVAIATAGSEDGEPAEGIRNAGTPDGARKGWETRRRNGWTPKQRPKGTGRPERRQEVADVEAVLDAAYASTDSRAWAKHSDIDGSEAEAIRRRTRESGNEAPDLSGWARIVEADKVNKILPKHLADRYPVEEEDFRRLPELLANPERQSWEEEAGKPPRLRTEIRDGRTVVVVEEAYTGRNTLALLSIYRP